MAGSRQLHESHLWESSWWTHCPILFFVVFFGFAAGHYPPEELVSLGNHGETIFFFEATELVWAIGIFWWPASFFLHLLGPCWGSTLGLPTPGEKPTWGSGAFMVPDQAVWLTVQGWRCRQAYRLAAGDEVLPCLCGRAISM